MLQKMIIVFVLFVTLAACAPKLETASPVSSTPEAGSSTQAPTSHLSTAVADELTTFTDSEIPFSLEFPTGWIMTTMSSGSRRLPVYLITSMDYVPNVSMSVLEGETVITVSFVEWKPSKDLDAFLEAQKQNWTEQGYILVSEELTIANNGAPLKYFILDAPDARYHTVFAMAGDLYVILSGRGDGQIVRQIGLTIR